MGSELTRTGDRYDVESQKAKKKKKTEKVRHGSFG